MRDDTALIKELEIFWQTNIPPSSRICVAVSGGADSVALVHLLARTRKRLSIAGLGIAHVNHRLRGSESDGDERFVRALARKHALPFHPRRLSQREIPARGIEEWARKQRYAFFASVMKTNGYDFTATAHTADDQAETVLLRILRGSGIKGLCGIAPVRDDRIIRPLLAIPKKTLTTWLTNHEIDFREDSSNTNTDYARNWMRHTFLPSLVKMEPHCVELLTAVADKAAEIDRILKPLVNKWLNRYVVKREKDFFSVDRKGLDDEVIVTESLMSLLRERHVEFDRLHIESMEGNKDKIGKTFLLPSGWRYRPLKETLEFFKGKKDKKFWKRSFSHSLKVGAVTRCGSPEVVISVERIKRSQDDIISFSDPWVVFLDAGKIKGKGPLVFRSVLQREKFWPYAAAGYVEVEEFLKKQRLQKNERMSKEVVSLKNGEILWVVGVRICERFKITPQTKEILKISYKPG